jgi:hypothetical protein
VRERKQGRRQHGPEDRRDEIDPEVPGIPAGHRSRTHDVPASWCAPSGLDPQMSKRSQGVALGWHNTGPLALKTGPLVLLSGTLRATPRRWVCISGSGGKLMTGLLCSANGATYHSPGHRPGSWCPARSSPEGATQRHADGAGPSALMLARRETWGVALGWHNTGPLALKTGLA